MTERITNRFARNAGMSIIEVIIVIVIGGILATTALRFLGNVSEEGRLAETKHEMDALARGIVGDERIESGHTRTDFGYVGDVGAFPPTLDALLNNPGGFATWKGPYVGNRFEQNGNDFKTDAWGQVYAYSGGVAITSTGSGAGVVRELGGTINDYLSNTVTGVVLDADGSSPGTDYADSVYITLFYPDGTGGITAASTTVDAGGSFRFNNIPIGNHTIELIYAPTADTLVQYVTVTPHSSPNVVFRFPSNVWYQSPSTLTTGLVAHWKLDDGSGTTAADASGSGYHGTLVNMNPAGAWVTGKIGGALEFDGSNDYVDIGNSLSPVNNFTVAAWVNPAKSDINLEIISKGNDGTDTQWELTTSTPAGQVDFRAVLSGVGSSGVRSTQSLPVGSWTFLVGTYDGTSWRIYWNGALDKISTMPGPVVTSSALYIGAIDNAGSPGKFWEGLIDDVRLYDRVLTNSEIQSLYLNGGGV